MERRGGCCYVNYRLEPGFFQGQHDVTDIVGSTLFFLLLRCAFSAIWHAFLLPVVGKYYRSRAVGALFRQPVPALGRTHQHPTAPVIFLIPLPFARALWVMRSITNANSVISGCLCAPVTLKSEKTRPPGDRES